MSDVLLIEDDDAAREMLAMSLRLEGYAVRTAGDGVAGLHLLDCFDPDVIVLDLGLPLASGFEVLHELRTADATRHTPVIAISGHDHGVRLARENPEFFVVLQKPFSSETLSAAIGRALRARRANGTLRARPRR